ncbi:ATP-dependent RNA helicase DHX30-like isoform X2 [Oratosquilla oratoria]|uniref:ATP-dependent RNA helicase DHX30-like isoform X2 n=1 Tax=Oratosquilla oratoria TaxID=337810 RepID=UPI003F75F5BB
MATRGMMQLFRIRNTIVNFQCVSSKNINWISVSRRLISTNLYPTTAPKRKQKTNRALPLSRDQLQWIQLAENDGLYVKEKQKTLLTLFPKCKSSLKNLYGNIATNVSRSYSCKIDTKLASVIEKRPLFVSKVHITWPRSETYCGYGWSKKKSELAAVAKAMEMLYTGGHVNDRGQPVMLTEEEMKNVKDEWKKPVSVLLDPELEDQGRELLQHFNDKVKPLLEHELPDYWRPELDDTEDVNEWEDVRYTNTDQNANASEELRQGANILNIMNGQPYVPPREDKLATRSQSMLLHHHFRQNNSIYDNSCLPVVQHKDDIIEALENHQVLVIAGDTGSGKSTQVPQIILNSWVMRGQGAECNIVITQPRRISATSLAKWVAKERNENLGHSVGYHVRLDFAKVKNPGGIMFCTTGMLLQAIQGNPQLTGVSHVIVDEVHERSVQTDILLILLKRIIKENPQLKILLMSASFNVNSIMNYFGGAAFRLDIPGTLYPLTRHFIPHSLSELNLKPERYKLENLFTMMRRNTVNLDLVVDVITSIHKSRPPGAILCFLPGWGEIRVVQQRLESDQMPLDSCKIIPLHSKLSTIDQEEIFSHTPKVRKIILATNIAETSITVDDVVYVVDPGYHRELRYNSALNMCVMETQWIAQANSKQRAGRAGRVQPGEVFHLYSNDLHSEMDTYPLPEIMRIPLEHIILQSKAYCGEESAAEFLSEAVSVPTKSLIRKAIKNLENLEMIESGTHEEGERLLPLGKRVVHFSTPPNLSKALVYGSLFRCLSSLLTICASYGSGRNIFKKSVDTGSEIRDLKQEVNSESDIVAMENLFQEWYDTRNAEKADFVAEYGLCRRSLWFIQGIRTLFTDHLVKGHLLESVSEAYKEEYNLYSENPQLVLGMLLLSSANVFKACAGTISGGILKPNAITIYNGKGDRVSTVSSSVHHKINNLETQFLMSIDVTKCALSHRLIARDLSTVLPITVMLFYGNRFMTTRENDKIIVSIDGRKHLTFVADESSASFVVNLREALHSTAKFLLETRGVVPESEIPREVEEFWDSLVEYCNILLQQNVPE